MRSIGAAQVALDTMLIRVTDPSRKTFGKYLHEHGMCNMFPEALCSLFNKGTVIADIAKSRAEIESARLLVLSAALMVNNVLCSL
jgi:acyl-CoA dehydrogenase